MVVDNMFQLQEQVNFIDTLMHPSSYLIYITFDNGVFVDLKRGEPQLLRWLSDDGPLSFALFVRAAQCAIEAGLLNEVVPEDVLGSAT